MNITYCQWKNTVLVANLSAVRASHPWQKQQAKGKWYLISLGGMFPLSHPFTQESKNHFGHKMSHFNSLFLFLFSWHPFCWFVFLLPQAIISTGDSDKYAASSLQLNSWSYSFVLRWLIATVRKMKIYWFLFSTESVFYFSDMT